MNLKYCDDKETIAPEVMVCPVCGDIHHIVYVDAWPVPLFILKCKGLIINIKAAEWQKEGEDIHPL